VRKKVLLAVAGLAGVALLAAAGFAGYMELVKAGYVRYNRFDRRERGSLKEGGAAPDLELTRYDGSTVRLSQLWSQRPVMLVFGSCT
jgi:hypothetical protein